MAPGLIDGARLDRWRPAWCWCWCWCPSMARGRWCPACWPGTGARRTRWRRPAGLVAWRPSMIHGARRAAGAGARLDRWRPACRPAAAGAAHQALPVLVPGLIHGAGLVPAWCPSMAHGRWRPAWPTAPACCWCWCLPQHGPWPGSATVCGHECPEMCIVFFRCAAVPLRMARQLQRDKTNENPLNVQKLRFLLAFVPGVPGKNRFVPGTTGDRISQ